MPPNYLQLDNLITTAVGEILTYRDDLSQKRDLAIQALHDAQGNQEKLGETARRVTAKIDRMLRCAAPTCEPLAAQYAPGALPNPATLLGTDGSQIQPDLKQGMWWGLTNSAAVTIHLCPEMTDPPVIRTETELFLEHKRFTSQGMIITPESVDLYRDLRERELLAETVAAKGSQGFRLGLLDGQLELWGSRDPALRGQYLDSLKKCVQAFEQMQCQDAAYAGYVDGANSELLVRLLEIALTPDSRLHRVRQERPLLGLTDRDIFGPLLQPGHRSAVFELRTRARGAFSGDLAIHLFFLNVGSDDDPQITRIEIPAYLVGQAERLGQIQAAILHQCQVLPNVRYPYVLIRAHEAARVDRQDLLSIQPRMRRAYLMSGLGLTPTSPKADSKEMIR